MNSELTLVIVIGLQGTGKTTVAKKVGGRLDAVMLRADVIRRELFKNSQYTQEESDRVFDEMFRKTEELLREKKSVVLDTMFVKNLERVHAKTVADRVGAKFHIVEVIATDKVVKERIEARTDDESEAKYKHYLEFKSVFEPVSGDHITIDNSGSIEDVEEQLDKVF